MSHAPETTKDPGRRWYHHAVADEHWRQPDPPRRTDLMGFNSTCWMAAAWILILVLALSPWPWW